MLYNVNLDVSHGKLHPSISIQPRRVTSFSSTNIVPCGSTWDRGPSTLTSNGSLLSRDPARTELILSRQPRTVHAHLLQECWSTGSSRLRPHMVIDQELGGSSLAVLRDFHERRPPSPPEVERFSCDAADGDPVSGGHIVGAHLPSLVGGAPVARESDLRRGCDLNQMRSIQARVVHSIHNQNVVRKFGLELNLLLLTPRESIKNLVGRTLCACLLQMS